MLNVCLRGLGSIEEIEMIICDKSGKRQPHLHKQALGNGKRTACSQQRGQSGFSGGDYFVAPDVKFRIFHLAFRVGENIPDSFTDSLIGTFDSGEAGNQLF